MFPSPYLFHGSLARSPLLGAFPLLPGCSGQGVSHGCRVFPIIAAAAKQWKSRAVVNKEESWKGHSSSYLMPLCCDRCQDRRLKDT